MTDTEFAELLKAVRLTDADQFEQLCRSMSGIATECFDLGSDFAWESAAKSLRDAGQFVAMRSGN